MLRLNLDLESKGRPSKDPDEKYVKFFKVYCSEEEYTDFTNYCKGIGIPVSRWFGEKMRRTLRTVKKVEQKPNRRR
ncbi:MAG: hypothetical protein ACOYWZ_14830 [Bacillota bacterium]